MAVFRVNNAPVGGFEKHVGTKTTVRVMSPSFAGYREGKELQIYTATSQKQGKPWDKACIALRI